MANHSVQRLFQISQLLQILHFYRYFKYRFKYHFGTGTILKVSIWHQYRIKPKQYPTLNSTVPKGLLAAMRMKVLTCFNYKIIFIKPMLCYESVQLVKGVMAIVSVLLQTGSVRRQHPVKHELQFVLSRFSFVQVMTVNSSSVYMLFLSIILLESKL